MVALVKAHSLTASLAKCALQQAEVRAYTTGKCMALPHTRRNTVTAARSNNAATVHVNTV